MSVDELRARLHRERGALPHCVYRAYDDDSVLLYVGCTYDFDARRDQHSRKSKWSPMATRWSVRWFSCRTEALEAERAAIESECPKHNVSYVERARRSAVTYGRQVERERDEARADLRRVMAELRPGQQEVSA